MVSQGYPQSSMHYKECDIDACDPLRGSNYNSQNRSFLIHLCNLP